MVIRCAVPAIWPSGARPRPISQRPPIASSRISAPPVISSATTTAADLPGDGVDGLGDDEHAAAPRRVPA